MRRRKEEEDRLDCLVLIAFLIVAILEAIALYYFLQGEISILELGGSR